jgi:hypothetical protein
LPNMGKWGKWFPGKWIPGNKQGIRLHVLWVKPCRLGSFYCIMFLDWFFLFQPLTINLLKIEFHNLFWLTFYIIIIISWPWSRVWQVNLGWLKLFFVYFLWGYLGFITQIIGLTN